MRRLGPALVSALRSLRIWSAVLQLLFFLWWDAQAWSYPGGVTQERQERRQRRRARWLTAQLLTLGSAFIKLGQLLSARPDVLPASWVAELSSLQDSVPAFSFDTAQSLLEQELKNGRPDPQGAKRARQCRSKAAHQAGSSRRRAKRVTWARS